MPVDAQQFGKYRLLRRIASGGMGEVHLAKLQGPNGFEKLLVIKRLLTERQGEQKFVDMFFSEARVAAQLGHSNVAQVYEVGTIDTVPYIAMEYVHGKSLRKVLDAARNRNGGEGGDSVPTGLVVQMVQQLCQGLSFAHDARHSSGAPLGLIHRDINPHNVLISYRGEVKVIDFGIAKSELTWEKTQVGTIKGTVVYMSPEQSLGQKLDKRSDLFSVGIVLYEALSGTNPFHKGTLGASLDAIRQAQPPLLSQLRPELVAFVPLLARTLARSPDQRYGDCADLAAALAALENSGIVPRPKQSLAAYMTDLFAQEILEEERALEATDMASVPNAQPASRDQATRVSPRPAAPRPAPAEVDVEAGQGTLVTPNPLERPDDDEAYPTRIEAVDLSRRPAGRRVAAAHDDGADGDHDGAPEATQIGAAVPAPEATERTPAPEATQLGSPRPADPAPEKRGPMPMAPLSSRTVTPSPFGVMLRPLQPAWRRSTGAIGRQGRALGSRLLARYPSLAGWLVGGNDTEGLRGGRFGLPLALAGALLVAAGGTALWAGRNGTAPPTRVEVDASLASDVPPAAGETSRDVAGEPAAEEAGGGPLRPDAQPALDVEAPPPAAAPPASRYRPARGGVRSESTAADGRVRGQGEPRGNAMAPGDAAPANVRRAGRRSPAPAVASSTLTVATDPPLAVRHNGQREGRSLVVRPGSGLIEFGAGLPTDLFSVRVRYTLDGGELTYTVDASPWADVYGADGVELGRTPLTWPHASPSTTFELRNPRLRSSQTISLRVGTP